MKLLYYVGTGSNKFGGLEKFNIELFKLLKDQGTEIIVVYRRPIVDGAFRTFLDENGIRYCWINNSFAITGESKLTNARCLAKIIRTEKPDVIHYNFGNLYDVALSRLLNPTIRFKAIYTAHCHTNLAKPYLRTVFGAISPFVKRILCVSRAINNEFERHLHSRKSVTLYLGVYPNKFEREKARTKYGFNENEIIITNIAYHDPIKGVDVLVRAIDYLRNTLKVNSFRVLQIGGSPLKDAAESLKNLFKKSNLDDCFEFWGLRDDIEEIMAATDIYCQPSRSEGIPLSLMEAGMAGVSVVATNVGGISEVAHDGDNAILCTSEDYIAIAESIKKLIEDKMLREFMGNNGRKCSSENFNIYKQAERLKEIYMSL